MNEKKLTKIVGKNYLSQVRNEISLLEKNLQFGNDVASRYNMHKVNQNGNDYLALDARIVNKSRNQTGRGDYRYLFDKDNYSVSIAEHSPKQKSYKLVA